MKKLINWLIKKLGGYTKKQYEVANAAYKKAFSNMQSCYDKHTALEKTIRTVESCITIDNALGYTEDNVIAESRQQTYYQLGKAVYPYAKHFVTSDGKYIAAVNVQEVE